jgi:hypothetical protein
VTQNQTGLNIQSHVPVAPVLYRYFALGTSLYSAVSANQGHLQSVFKTAGFQLKALSHLGTQVLVLIFDGGCIRWIYTVLWGLWVHSVWRIHDVDRDGGQRKRVPTGSKGWGEEVAFDEEFPKSRHKTRPDETTRKDETDWRRVFLKPQHHGVGVEACLEADLEPSSWRLMTLP